MRESSCLVGVTNQLLTSLIDYRRREAVRRQRIESEQKRRDDLRDGYARLKSTLPSINQKSSKIVLLERGK